LVVIDLWERFRPLDKGKNGSSQYRSDYADLAKVQQLTTEIPELAIFVTNHQRKATADDIFDTISGTLGLNGGADTMMVIAREEGAKFLEARGRDIEDYAIRVEQDEQNLRWRNLGPRTEGGTTPERAKIIAAMQGKGAMSVKDICRAAGGDYDSIKVLLSKMHGAETLVRPKWGFYQLPNLQAELDIEGKI
jgi:hypothetical protein